MLKLSAAQGYPDSLETEVKLSAQKVGYRILPIDVPLPLVNHHWISEAEIIIKKLVWENQKTSIEFEIHRVYSSPIPMK